MKNGFYLIADLLEGQSVPYEQIANQLYGPSYLSLEWALSYYGMIPEGVYAVTFVTCARTKNFKTILAEFQYQHLSMSRFSCGQTLVQNLIGNYLIAAPEKAIVDLVYFKCKNMSAEDLKTDLIESKRIDVDKLKKLNKEHLLDVKNIYKSKSVNTLIEVIGLL